MNGFLSYDYVFVLDKAHVVESLFGKAVWTWFAEPAHGPSRDQSVRCSGSCIPVAHVRHGPGRRVGLRGMVRISDDRRVCVLGHT